MMLTLHASRKRKKLTRLDEDDDEEDEGDKVYADYDAGPSVAPATLGLAASKQSGSGLREAPHLKIVVEGPIRKRWA
ncbi:unnamed protein product [Arctogadus glacialis]